MTRNARDDARERENIAARQHGYKDGRESVKHSTGGRIVDQDYSGEYSEAELAEQARQGFREGVRETRFGTPRYGHIQNGKRPGA